MKNLAPLPELPERYRPLGLLGEGATGSVYRADDLVLGVDVALKVVRPNLAMHARFRARFAREVALSAQVVHPRLVPVTDTGLLPDGRPFVALAYADGGSLSNLMRRKPGIVEGLRVIDQVLDALAALHARGVLHQDLKPANVLLHTTGPDIIDAWVADLGVAAALSELAMNKRSISGTPTWMAPEQLTGTHHELGPWTDLYAVGLVLHALLVAPPSTDPREKKATLDQRLERAPDLPSSIPAPLAEVMRNLLDPDPRQRYDRAADVRRALRDVAVNLADRPLEGDLAMLGDKTDTVGPGNTSFSQSILPEAQEAVVVPRRSAAPASSAPRWNRVPPDRMPLRPPASRGGTDTSRTSLGLFSLRDPPMVAREPLRRLMWQKARETILSGRPQVVLVIGEGGSGKSRVVESVVTTLEEGGFMEAIRLRYHSPAGVDDGYRGAVREILAPWNDTRARIETRLQRWLARDQQVAPQAVAAEAQVLARWCGYRQPGEEPVNAAVGLAFLYRHLDVRAWRGGACLVLEDVQDAQAEGDGLGICDAVLSESVGRRPVVIFATISSDAIENSPVLASRVKSLIARGALQVNCSRLNTSQMEQLLIMSLNLAPGLAAQVAPACDGSPSFAMLMLRDWAGRGLLTRNSDMHFVLRDDLSPEHVLAPDLATLCQRRMAGALSRCEDPDAAGAVLAATALAGQVPPVSVIQAVDPEGLDALLATGLLRQRGWRIVFESPTLRDLALELALRRPDVKQLHRKLADAWDAVGERTGIEVNLPLGEHRLKAGMPQAASAPLLQAAQSALIEGRYSLSLEAATLASEGADVVGALPGRVLARRQIAEALLELDRADEAGQVLADTWRLGHIDRNTTAHLRVLEARVAIEAGELVQARRLLDNALMTFEATRDRVGQVEGSHCLGVLLRLEGRPDEAADQYARMLRTNRNDLRREAIALFGLVESSIAAGRIGGVDRTVQRLRQVARDSGDTRNIAQATFAGGLLHLRRRNLGEAERHFLTARALAATLGADSLLLACLTNLAEISRYRGDETAAEEILRTAARLATEHGWHLHAATSRVQLGLLALLRGADRLSHIEIARAERLLEAHPRHHGWLAIAVVRALWCAEDDEEAICRVWWKRARKQGLGRQPVPDLWVPLERLAQVAADRGWSDLSSQATAVAHGREGDSGLVDVEIDDDEDEFEDGDSYAELDAVDISDLDAEPIEDPSVRQRQSEKWIVGPDIAPVYDDEPSVIEALEATPEIEEKVLPELSPTALDPINTLDPSGAFGALSADLVEPLEPLPVQFVDPLDAQDPDELIEVDGADEDELIEAGEADEDELIEAGDADEDEPIEAGDADEDELIEAGDADEDELIEAGDADEDNDALPTVTVDGGGMVPVGVVPVEIGEEGTVDDAPVGWGDLKEAYRQSADPALDSVDAPQWRHFDMSLHADIPVPTAPRRPLKLQPSADEDFAAAANEHLEVPEPLRVRLGGSVVDAIDDPVTVAVEGLSALVVEDESAATAIGPFAPQRRESTDDDPSVIETLEAMEGDEEQSGAVLLDYGQDPDDLFHEESAAFEPVSEYESQVTVLALTPVAKGSPPKRLPLHQVPVDELPAVMARRRPPQPLRTPPVRTTQPLTPPERPILDYADGLEIDDEELTVPRRSGKPPPRRGS